ncbi:aromatic hydrocarbon degradation protein [Syntrophotalea acetylenivorans]|uniref:Aromatic hydrocarbon degradation protein n=1 Tax=Syntrophotalea acetylenivorans TaxID=1842532 RepID=A0A1L3GNP9_9BACT|nr:TonB-dependent receptor [Syntrophotalea acetylenivorans]APG27557.1 aromatic hydrocarbon degradation protein [Syntrophotalea acetylenivorans]
MKRTTKQHNSLLFICLAFALITCLGASQSHASGYGIFVQGADALGQANSTIAHSDGPSAVYFNPALLTSLTGTQIEVGTTAVIPSRKFKSDSDGSREKTEDKVYFPSTFYLSHQLNERWSAGLAVFNPFGLGTVWDSDWEGNSIATKSRITTFNINPSIAYQVTPRLAIGAGLDILILDAKLKNEAITDQQLTGDGEGIGFNVGLQLQITEELSFGAAYRSKVDIDIDGKVTFSPSVQDFFPNTDVKTSITLPAQFTAGLAYSFSPNWVVEAGVRWEDWSSFDELKVELEQVSALPSNSVSYPRNWDDTWAFNVGTKYRLNDRVALMAGYLYGDNPVPDSTFEPAIPDSDTHLFTVGSELTFDQLKVTLAYGFQLQEDRDKEDNEYGDVANGEYENYLHLAAISLSYAF